MGDKHNRVFVTVPGAGVSVLRLLQKELSDLRVERDRLKAEVEATQRELMLRDAGYVRDAVAAAEQRGRLAGLREASEVCDMHSAAQLDMCNWSAQGAIDNCTDAIRKLIREAAKP